MRRWRVFLIVAILSATGAIPGWLFAAAEGKAPEAAAAAPVAAEGPGFHYFSFLSDPHYDIVERGALWVVLGVAVAGLLYAGMLVGQVLGADQGTPKMQGIAEAIRQGANAYLGRQFKAIIFLVFLLTAILYFANPAETGQEHVSLGRAAGLLRGGDVLVAGRLRGHEPGGPGQPPRRRRGADQLRRRACSSATAPARSPAC